MCLIVIPLLINKDINFILTCIAILGIGPIIATCLNRNWIRENMVFINNLTHISLWGYYIKKRRRKKIFYVSSFDKRRSKYGTFIVAIKKVVCFYNLAINMEYSDTDTFDYCGIDFMCDYLLDVKRCNKDKVGMIIPIIICSCLCKNMKKESIERVHELVKEIGVDEREKLAEISRIVYRDIYGDDRKFDEKECNDICELILLK